jgi:hypothetical protein
MPKLARGATPPPTDGLDEFAQTSADEEAAMTEAEIEQLTTETPEAEEVGEVKAVAVRDTKRKPTGRSTSGLFSSLEDTREFARLLYWGREGSGKTDALASLSNRGRILVINAEGGLKKQTLINRGYNVANIQVWPQPGERVTHAGLDEVYREIKSDLQDDPDSWVAVAFDSITEISADLIRQVGDDRVNKARKNGATISDIDAFFTDRGDYGYMTKMLNDILAKYRDLPVHLIVTALERRDVDEDTSRVTYGPQVSPALQDSLAGKMDVFIRTKAADEERDYFRGAVRKMANARTKDRYGWLPDVIVEPTAERVIGYIDQTLTADTDPLQEVLRAADEKPAPKRTTRTRKTAPKESAA